VTNYQNDPNINRRNQTGYRDNTTSYTGWIIGGLVALALVIGLFTMFGRDTAMTNTATNTNRPATTTTNAPAVPGPVSPAPTNSPSTTGSGAVR
jgi:hypothetical protein